MDEEHKLRQEIAADPDNDTLRLAFANWLDDHEQPGRAKFIRVQISLANQKDEINGRPWTDELQSEYTKREEDLRHQYGDVLRKELEPIRSIGFATADFERGFPEALHLSNPKKQLPALATLGETSTVRTLWLREKQLDDDDLKYLPALPQLKELDLAQTQIGDPAMVHLTTLSHLKKLDLSDTYVTDDGLRTLAQSPHLSADLQLESNSGYSTTLGEIRKVFGIEHPNSPETFANKAGATWAQKTQDRTGRVLE